MRAAVIALKIVLMVLLFAPALGCSFHVEVPCDDLGLGLDAGLGGLSDLHVDATVDPTQPEMDAGTHDAWVYNDPFDPMDAGVAEPMDASVSTTTPDTGSSSSSMDGGSATPEPVNPMVVQAVTLAATACHGRRMTNPADWLTAVNGAHMRLWHICYRTPIATTAGVPLPMGRPETVSLHWYDHATGMRELARVPAPRTANPWTANFLVAVPVGVPPVFNVSNDYAGTPLYAVQSPGGTQPLALSGVLQLWEVDPHGLQTDLVARPWCRDPARHTGANTFFWPDMGDCDPLDSSCNDMFLYYQCRNP